jgi:hypothetical protein
VHTDCTSLAFGETVVEVFSDSLRITLPDGATVLAMAEDTPEYRATALETGYNDDLDALCREHEIIHVALAHLLKTTSPTMDHVSERRPVALWLREMEEDAVLAIQRYTRALGIDLVRLFAEQ